MSWARFSLWLNKSLITDSQDIEGHFGGSITILFPWYPSLTTVSDVILD